MVRSVKHINKLIMATFDKLTGLQKVRASLHRDVRAISTETCHFLGLEITKTSMEVIAELVFKKLSVYGSDLEAFAKHAKRSTINSDDVKLLVRRNPSLFAHVNSLVPATTNTGPKRKKSSVKPQETPAKGKDYSNKSKEDKADKRNTEIEEEIFLEDKKKLEDKEDDILEKMIVDEIDLTFD